MALVLNPTTNELYLSLSKELRSEVDKQIKSLSIQVSNTVDELALDVSTYIESSAGLSQKQIISNLSELQKAGGGVFADATKGLTRAITDKTFLISDDIFFGGLKTEAEYNQKTDKLMWQAMLVNTCPSCLQLHGKVKLRAVWNIKGGPNVRNTLCTIHGSCHCILVLASSMPSTEEMRKPFKIQSARIRKASKLRGKPYAKTTKVAFLGQINNGNSTISDLRKIKKVKS